MSRGELADYFVEAADEPGQGVALALPDSRKMASAVRGDLGLGAVEVESIQDGVDVQEQTGNVAGVPSIQGDLGEPVVAACGRLRNS